MEKYLDIQRKLEKEFHDNDMEISVAKIIIAAVIGCRVAEIIQHFDDDVTNENMEIIRSYADEYLAGRPIQYVINSAYFYGLDLYVDEMVLIPRMETEELVNWVLNDFSDEPQTFVDAGCGSGCIALAIKKNRPKWRVYGTDISDSALIISKENAETYGLFVDFLKGDFVKPAIDKVGTIDIIVSNPPYIAPNDPDIQSVVKNYEPPLALFTEDKYGMDNYKKLMEQISTIDFKAAYFEFGWRQKELLSNLIEAYNYKAVFKKDMNGLDRMVKITKN